MEPMSNRPPRIGLVLALCAALGALGFSLGLSGLLAWNQPIPEKQVPEPPAPPPGMEEDWAPIRALYEQLPAVNEQVFLTTRPAVTALAGVNFLSSAALFFGALASRMRSSRGLSYLRTGLVLSQAYAFLAVVVNVWVDVEVLGALQPTLQPLLEQEGPVRAAAVVFVFSLMSWFAVVVGIALAQLVFYVWAHRWTRRPEVVRVLAPAAR